MSGGPARRRLATEAPISAAQRRLWFLEQLDPERPRHSFPLAYWLRGRLDVAALQRAFAVLPGRLPALRSVFVAEGGEPERRLSAETTLELPLHDLSGDFDPAASARAWARSDAAHPFDLAVGPLARGALLRVSDEQHLLYLHVHHLVCDGPSLGLLMAELSAAYRAAVAGDDVAGGRAVPAEEAASEPLDEDAPADALTFWSDHLAGDLPLLELPAERSPGAARLAAGGQLAFELDHELAARVDALAAEAETDARMVLLAAFEAFLGRITGQAELLVGVPLPSDAAGAAREQLRCSLPIAAFRARLEPEQSFRQLLEDTEAQRRRVQPHRGVALERVIELLRSEGRLGDEPLFSAMLDLRAAPELSLGLPGIEHETLRLHSGAAPLDMLLTFERRGESLVGLFEYSTALFGERAAARLSRCLRTLLEGALREPERALGELPLLDEAQRQELLRDFNPEPIDRSSAPDTLHELVLRQARERPDALAVEAEGERLTYGELERRSRAVAARLIDRGVKPDQLVGICVERSVAMMVALMGILRAGGAYLPLDPNYPVDRLRMMLEDGEASVLIADPRLEQLLAPLEDLPLSRLWLDDELLAELGPDEAEAAEAVDDVPVDREHLAYTIYTSGSTGRPKGVLIEHRMIVNFLLAMIREPGIAPGDRLLAVTTLSFDMSKSELWLPLAAGATTVIVPSTVAADGEALLEALRGADATIMQATPVTWRMLVDAGWERTPRLTTITGGEPLAPDLAAAMVARSRCVWNGYGPTEATVYATQALIDDPDDITIGWPLDNTRCYILDDRLAPVPIGVTGELWVAGDGVARGYHRRPELNSERFVEDPFAAELGFAEQQRMYRTGDLARWRANGWIEHLGRNDHQVKVRGYRIELGEIEAALIRHPGVREAVVMAREDTPGDQRLVAYVIYSDDGADVTPTGLRKHVRGGLPDYMVPQDFVPLELFPKTPNGKIDRKALPPPSSAAASAADEALVAPRNWAEELIAEVWQELLGAERVGVQNNFFDLGGHSLLSMRAIARIEQKTGKRVTARAMAFDTLEQIAPLLHDDDPPATGAAMPAATRPRARAATSPASAPPLAAPKLGEQLRERVVTFGPEQGLVGILCEPARDIGARRAAVLLLNAGLLPRVGPGRLNVELARLLARRGFASLRVDLSGLGDSEVREGAVSHVERSVADIGDALELLAARGYPSAVVGGICSGALNAHAAAVAWPQVCGAIMLDGYAYRTRGFYLRYYGGRVIDPKRYVGLLKRKTAPLRERLQRALDRTPLARWVSLAPGSGASARSRRADPRALDFDDEYQHFPPEAQVERDLVALFARRVPLLYTYSGGWNDYCIYEEQLADRFGHVEGFERFVTVQRYPLADHTYTLLRDRRLLFDGLLGWLEQNVD